MYDLGDPHRSHLGLGTKLHDKHIGPFILKRKANFPRTLLVLVLQINASYWRLCVDNCCEVRSIDVAVLNTYEQYSPEV